eukprot:TRINITY_DN2289_c0_g2_i1.p1 TRINITY_DN2289_c0_g2~~TRINITY_DN2289_c0_g2_i1.p1  ORF type:complete len:1642 (-),score=322.61 TRINITY_DN2289_c0_g2_i1:205-5130(-)
MEYALPPTGASFDSLLKGLKRFTNDLSSGGTDSSARGYAWSHAPDAAKIASRQVLAPRSPARGVGEFDKISSKGVPAVTIDIAPPSHPRTKMQATRPRPRSASPATRLAAEQQSTGAGQQSTSRSAPQPPTSRRQDSQDPAQRRGRPRASGHQYRAASMGPSQFEGQKEESVSPFSTPSPPALRHSPAPPKASPRIPSTRHIASSVLTDAPKSARATLAPLPAVPRPPPAAANEEDKLARTLPAPAAPSGARQPRTVDEYVARASQRLLAQPGLPHLRWRTADSEADYRQLRPGEFFNHFQNNRMLTTKAGLAQSLSQHMVSAGVDVDSFFPRCYDTAHKSEREDFLLDFRRSAVLKIASLHQRLHRDQSAGHGSAGYRCNLDLLGESEHVLRRWHLDLDPDHLDEQGDEHHDVSEDTWDALMLYSELTQAQLCAEDKEGDMVRLPKWQHIRPGGGELAPAGYSGKRTGDSDSHKLQLEGAAQWRPAQLQDWPEFQSHTWGKLDDERQSALDELLERLEKRFSQWSLQGGWSSRNVWIVKPGTNSKGSGIECMSSLPGILHHCDRMPNRIVQKYIERPLLLFSGRKFDVRQWVLVKSVSPLKIFLFSECYLRLCNGMYDLGDLKDRERHISNWQVNKHGRNVVDGAAVSLSDFRSELLELTGRGDYWEKEILPSVRNIVVETLRSAEGQLLQRAESFELFGFDLMVDEAMKVWLLEVNLSPGCEGRTPFLEQMLERMSHRLIEVAVLGKEEPDGQKPDWIKICDDGAAESSPSARDIVLSCIDYGLPCDPGLPLWQEGYDQQDWHKVSEEKGFQAVCEAMAQHADRRAKHLQDRFKDSKVFSDVIVPGLDLLRKDLDQSQQIVVVGDTSSGKSTTVNFLLGYPISYVAQGIGTRRPCVITLTPDPHREAVLFQVKFQKNAYIVDESHTQLADVASLVQSVNDPKAHPEWFDCLNSDSSHSSRLRPEDAFDDAPVYIQLTHKDIDRPIHLVDLPGLSSRNLLTTQIALSYMKPDTTIVLVLGKDHPNNGGLPHLAAAMRECCRTVAVQNFATAKLFDNSVSETYQAILDKIRGIPAAVTAAEAAKRAVNPLRPWSSELAVQGVPLRAPKARNKPHRPPPVQTKGKEQAAPPVLAVADLRTSLKGPQGRPKQQKLARTQAASDEGQSKLKDEATSEFIEPVQTTGAEAQSQHDERLDESQALLKEVTQTEIETKGNQDDNRKIESPIIGAGASSNLQANNREKVHEAEAAPTDFEAGGGESLTTKAKLPEPEHNAETDLMQGQPVSPRSTKGDFPEVQENMELEATRGHAAHLQSEAAEPKADTRETLKEMEAEDEFEEDFEDESPRATKSRFLETKDSVEQDSREGQTAQLQSESAEPEADDQEILKEASRAEMDATDKFEDDFEDESPRATTSKNHELQEDKVADGSQAQSALQPSTSTAPPSNDHETPNEAAQVGTTEAEDEFEDDFEPESSKATRDESTRAQEEEVQRLSQSQSAQPRAEPGKQLKEATQSAAVVQAFQGTEEEDEFEDDFESESPTATKGFFPAAHKGGNLSEETTPTVSPRQFDKEDARGQEKQDDTADATAAGANRLSHGGKDLEEDDDGDPFEASAGSEAKLNPSSPKKQGDREAEKYDEDFEPD